MGPRCSGADAQHQLTAGRACVSVITIAWRNEAWADAFAQSLVAAAQRCPHTSVELVVVVNGPDGEDAVPRLADLGLPTTVVRLPLNAGFAGGANAGVEVATGDVLVVSNLDVSFDEAFIEQLTETLEWEMLVPRVLEPGADGTMSNGAARRRSFHRHAWLRPQPEASGPVQAGNGSCLILRREVADRRTAEVGGLFDAEYHSFNEDVDLFWWANRRGVRITFAPEVVVNHGLAGSFGQRHRFGERTAAVQRQAMANYRVTVWKHAVTVPDWFGWLTGEVIYLGQAVSAARLAGIGRYARSWWDSVVTVRAIKRRHALR